MSFSLNLKNLSKKEQKESPHQPEYEYHGSPLQPAEVQYETSSSNDTLILTVLLGLVLAMALAIAFLYFFYMGPEEGQLAAVGTPDILQPDQGYSYNTSAFAGIALKARSAIVFDLKFNQVLFGEKPDDQLPLASLTKLMTALVASETMDTKQEIVITSESLGALGDSGLEAGESWELNNLLDFTLITSSNDAAQAIASAAGAFLGSEVTKHDPSLKRLSFVQKMNAKARELGLEQTYFVNASGLDEGATAGGAYGSARDTALLLDHLLLEHPDLFEATTKEKVELTSLDGIEHTARNTNKRVGNIPGLIASKTGFTDLAGGNLAIIFDISMNHPIAIVVLGSTLEERFTDIETLVAATRVYFAGEGE